MNTPKDYVSLKQAQILLALGFDWECEYVHCCNFIARYSQLRETNKKESVPAPTLAQAQKWLREVKNIYVFSNKAIAFPDILKGKFYWEIINKELEVVDRCRSCDLTETYEQSLSAGIDKAIELLKEEGK